MGCLIADPIFYERIKIGVVKNPIHCVAAFFYKFIKIIFQR